MSDLTLHSGVSYLIGGRVTLGNGNGGLITDNTLIDGSAVQRVTLTIEPGTHIYGKTAVYSSLVITRGSKINAIGTSSAPILFSSDDEGLAGSGEWEA